MTDPTPTRAEVVHRMARNMITSHTKKSLAEWGLALEAENQALRERAEAAEKDEEEAYQIGLRDGYEKGVQDADERTGGDGEYVCCVGDDPDDRHCPTPQHMLQRMADRWDAALRAEAAAWNDAIDAAKAWHRCEIARLQNQVSENNAYLTRVGASSQDTEANRYCLGLISAHQKSIAAIRALRRAAPTEGEA